MPTPKVAQFYAGPDDKVFFEDSPEPCHVLVALVPDIDNVTREQHTAAWHHVADCVVCLRNVVKSVFMLGFDGMPLPLFIRKGGTN